MPCPISVLAPALLPAAAVSPTLKTLPALPNLPTHAPTKFAGSNPRVTTPSIRPDINLNLSVPGSAICTAATRPGLIVTPLYLLASNLSL